jgi:hypothetical protein
MRYGQNSGFRYAALVAFMLGVAWQYRRDRFIMFGGICGVFFALAMIAESQNAEQVSLPLMFVSGICAFISLGFGIRSLAHYLIRKRKGT